jgi:hypothetical protein
MTLCCCLKTHLAHPVFSLHCEAHHACVGHPHLQIFDNLLRTAASKVCNVTLSDDQWQQASLPVRYGGLGIRRVSSLAPSAFLASAAGTRELQRRILDQSNTAADDPTFEVVMQQWRTMPNSEAPTDFRQRAVDMTVVATEFDALLSRARLLAAASEHSGDWLHALPISACGLQLDNEAIRVATGLRLGCSLCESHQSPCGAATDARGVHGLSCRHSAGRQSRHHYLNDLIYGEHSCVPAFLPPRNPTAWPERMVNDQMD